MTEQREFPFFVNGQFWKILEVTEEDIRKGYKDWVVLPEPKFITEFTTEKYIPKVLINIYHVRFQLVEVREFYPENKQDEDVKLFNNFRNYMAVWFTGFWVCDKNVYLKNGVLYKVSVPGN